MEQQGWVKKPAALLLHQQQSQERQKELDVLMEWVSERLASFSDIPRVDDVVQYAYTTLGLTHLTRAAIAKRLRLHPVYNMTSRQQRAVRRAKRYRPIVTNSLGMLHGDIGFYPVVREYETPKKYQGGFLVLKDVLSRFLYVVLLNKTRTADSIISALKTVLQMHENIFGKDGHKIKSIAFDRETSVMSKKVQAFLKDNAIQFHAFKFSSSKSKMAENAIRLIRTDMKRALKQNPGRRWWQMMDTIVNIQNNKPIRVNNKTLSWAPSKINEANVRFFIDDLYNAAPAHFFNQFELSPQVVRQPFKYPIGALVRPKLIVTSSAVIGQKRSEVSLEENLFFVTEHIPYINARLEVGLAYRCTNKQTLEEEIFDEHDLAESTEDAIV